MGGPGFKIAQNLLQHSLSLKKHLVVPESKHPKSSRCDLALAMFVVATTIHVLSAIELDRNLRFKTREIGDVAADGHCRRKR